MPTIQCQNCYSEDFRNIDGIFFCNRCETESQEHGREVVVEAETLGGFAEGIASTLQKKRVDGGGSERRRRNRKTARRRRRYLGSFKCSFTSVDAFSFMLKSWTDEAILLGADESLRHNVEQLWVRYLQKCRLGFLSETERVRKRSVSFRDLQVAITGRKRLLNRHTVTEILKAESRSAAAAAAASDRSSVGQDEGGYDKVRRKHRRTFLRSVASDIDDSEGDLSSSSFGSHSFADSNDSFSLSLSSVSMSNTSGSEEATTSDIEKETEFDVAEEGDERTVHAHVLGRVRKHGRRRTWKENREAGKPTHPRMKTVFSVFALAVFATKGNWMTLADLTFFASCDTISYATSLLAIPKQMKMSLRTDRATFGGIFQPSMDHFRMRKLIFAVGSLMGLGTVDFAAHCPERQLLEVVARYLRELSLPAHLLDVMRNLLPASMLTEGFQFAFETSESMLKRKNLVGCPAVPSVDVYAMSLILLVLKVLFSLDDVTEVKASDEVADRPGAFAFTDWLKLSKLRCFLAVKHCHDLHERLDPLMPQVKKSPATLLRGVQKANDRFVSMDEHEAVDGEEESLNDEDGDEPGFGRNDWNVAARLKRLSAFYERSLLPTTSVKRHTLNLGYSDTPLHDFAEFQIALANDRSFQPNEERTSHPEFHSANLRKLLMCHDSRIVSVDEDDEEEEELIDPFATFLNLGLPPPMASRGTHRENAPEKLYHFGADPRERPGERRHRYWILSLPGNKGEPSVKDGRLNLVVKMSDFFFDDEYERLLLACLPNGFGWLLRYFACAVGASSTEVFACLATLEDFLFKTKSPIFEKLLATTLIHTRGVNGSNSTQDRIYV